MLESTPKIGDKVIAMIDIKGELIKQKKGNVYEIKGEEDNMVYFIGDSGDKVYIGSGTLHRYSLYKEEGEKKMIADLMITGSEVNAWDYYEDATDFSLEFRLLTNAGEGTLEVISEFQRDVAKLIKDKYSSK